METEEQLSPALFLKKFKRLVIDLVIIEIVQIALLFYFQMKSPSTYYFESDFLIYISIIISMNVVAQMIAFFVRAKRAIKDAEK